MNTVSARHYTYREQHRQPRRAGPGKPQRHEKKSWFSARVRWLLIFLLCLPAISYTVTLDAQVRSQFEGKRWALPARVYARPLEIYPSLSITQAEVRAELQAVGFREVGKLAEPGQYSRQGNTLSLYTRPFKFWDAEEPARKIAVSFADERLTRIVDMNTGQTQALVRLEPSLIGKIYPTHKEDRILVGLDEVPAMLIQALMVMEDRQFYEHHGVNPRSVIRAIWRNIEAGELVQGGSTITQQLIKNYYLTPDRTLSRKLNEAMMAVLLEFHYDKTEILEAYLNEVYLGQSGDNAIHGFGMASWFYFNRPIGQLKLSEMALLVGLVRSAAYYNPRRYPDRALERRNLVLDIMAKQGVISTLQAVEAKSEPIELDGGAVRGDSAYPAFMELVRQQLRSDYREEDLRSDGLQVFTTLDPRLQRQTEESLSRRIRGLERGSRVRKLEGAVVLTSTESGEVLALVGGRDAQFHGYNRALKAERSIGSLIKPAVYLAALENSRAYSLLSSLKDEPFEWKDKQGRVWKPSNYDGKPHGKVPLFKALANSYNLATVHLGFEVGLDKIKQTLVRMGVEREFEFYPSTLLGSLSLTPLEVAQMYQTLASGGFRVPLRAIHNVLTHDGKPLNRYALSVEQRFDPAPIYLLNFALSEVTRSGTATQLLKDLPGVALAGKTGTTNDYRDSWFAGFGNDMLAVVWLGRDDNKSIGLSGSTGALQVWSDLMQKIKPASLEQILPKQIEWRWVQTWGSRVKMPFIVGNAQAGAAQPRLPMLSSEKLAATD
jgi:penicillin-binding protein 1B